MDRTSGARKDPVNITKSLINKIVPPTEQGGRRVLWDERVKGFGLRVYSSGRIVYVLQYRLRLAGAKTATCTIGVHGSPWSPEAARQRALELLDSVRRGVDPRTAQAGVGDVAVDTRREREDAYWDFNAYADRYLAHVRAQRLRSVKDIEGTFARDLRPWFAGMSIREIGKSDIQALRVSVGERSTSAANKAHKWLNAAFQWGVEHDGLDASPMASLKRPFAEPKRKRVLADWEVALLWSVLPSMDPKFAMLERLLILTGQRLREVAGMRWEEVDLEAEDWIIPAARTKNKRDHLLPISPQVRRILEQIEPNADERVGLVLTTNGRTPISGFSKTQAAIRRTVAKASGVDPWRRKGAVAPWVRHDHRRTFSTGCGRLGIPIAHAEAALNHVSGSLAGVAGTYWLYQYASEKRRVMKRWGEAVERMLKANRVEFLI